MPTDTHVNKTMRIVSVLPFIPGCPIHIDISAVALSKPESWRLPSPISLPLSPTAVPRGVGQPWWSHACVLACARLCSACRPSLEGGEAAEGGDPVVVKAPAPPKELANKSNESIGRTVQDRELVKKCVQVILRAYQLRSRDGNCGPVRPQGIND